MTHQDIAKMNSECSNGFEFHLWRYVTYKDKEFIKRIPLGGNLELHVVIYWAKDCEIKQNAYGQSVSVLTGEYVPALHFSVWKEEGIVESSEGMGKLFIIPNAEKSKRKVYKKLQQLTKDYTTEKCMEIYNKS